MPTSSLVCHDLSFAWPDGTVVLDHLDCSFPTGITGLIGRNGSGKSTLLKLVVGMLTATGGSVTGADRPGYLPQDLDLHPDLRVAMVLGVADQITALARLDAGQGEPADLDVVGDRWDLLAEVAAVLDRLGLSGLTLERRVGTISGGEAVLLALAGLFLARPDVLVLDEPTNNLDAAARRRLVDAVTGWGTPVLLVSHDRDLLQRCEAIAELREQTVQIYGGNLAGYEVAVASEQEAARRAVRSAEADLRRQQRELREMRIKLDRRQRYARAQRANLPKILAGALKRNAQVSAGKLAGGHEAEVDRARRDLVESEERVRDDDLVDIDLPGTRVPAGRDIVVSEGLILRNGVRADLHLRGPERVGIVGPNGSGKTTLVATVLGDLPPAAGRVEVKVSTRLLPQRLALLADDVPVLTTVSRLAPAADDNTLRAELARFLLPAATIGRPARALSGGERFRASLAALLLAQPPAQLLVLDEPTNNLDLASVAELVSALRGYHGALLVVSHDERFLADLKLDRVLTIADQTLRPR